MNKNGNGNGNSVTITQKLEARPGKEQEAQDFLANGAQSLDNDPQIHSWQATRLTPIRFEVRAVIGGTGGIKTYAEGGFSKSITRSNLFKNDQLQIEQGVLIAQNVQHEMHEA